jgi:chemotaxis protein MotB
MRSKTTAAVVCIYAVALTGCVSRAEFDQVMFENRSLAAEKEEYSQRALDAEAQAEGFRRQLQMKEGELDMQRSLAGNLQTENDRLDEAVRTAQDILSKLSTDPDPPLIISNPLPPALDEALRSFAASHPDSVEYDSRRGVVRWKSDLLFASGKDVVRDDAKSVLRSFAAIINQPAAQGFEIAIVGHTDNEPIKHAARFGHPTNWHLSAHRSIAVAQELISSSVTADRVGVMGYSEYRPAADNSTPQGRSQNRRVEIMIIGKPQSTAVSQAEPASRPAPRVK